MKRFVFLAVTLAVVIMGSFLLVVSPPTQQDHDSYAASSDLPSWPRYYLSTIAASWFQSAAHALVPPYRRALQFQNLYFQVTILQGLMEYKLLDAVNGVTTCGGIAQNQSLDADFTCRFLRAGTALGLVQDVTKHKDGNFGITQRVYAVTSVGAYFTSQHSESVASLYQAIHSDFFLKSLQATATQSIQTGQSGVKEAFGMELFEYLPQHVDEAQLFDKAISQISHKIAKALVKDWKTPNKATQEDLVICDLGGGQGTAMVALAQEHAHVKGIVMEMPGPAQRARDYVAQHGLADRIQVVEGNFFEPIPPVMATCDVFYLKAIFHGWNDEDCVRIIQNIRHVATAGAKIVGHDVILGVDNAPYAPHLEYEKTLSDVTMMAYCHGGRERTADEYFDLFRQAGIANAPRLIKLRDFTSLVEVDL